MADEFETVDNDNYPIPELKSVVAGLPTRPGIYQYKNAAGKVIYVGKAKNLRNRVRSYFQSGKHHDAKTKAMVGKIVSVEVILVDSEAEAFLLEDNLIKQLRPRYNIMLKDDKTYPYVRITNEEYPKIYSTRTVVRDGSKYFGPYTDVRNLNHVLRVVRALFRVRSCDLKLTSEAIDRGRFRVCLDYHINKCDGPCENHITKTQYNENIRAAQHILTGKTIGLEKELESRMQMLSDEMKFEEALLVRNRLMALRDYNSKQKIVTTELLDRDVFGLFRQDNSACTIVMKIRDGKLIGKRHFIISNAEYQSDADLIQKTIEKWYLETEFIPGELLLPEEVEEMEYLTDWLSKQRKKTVRILIPKIGDKRGIIDMANTNAEYILKDYLLALASREQTFTHAVAALQRDLRLKNPPRHIECFDNSHIQGTDLVSSCVVFIDGKPKKSEYRKFINQTVEGNDDFAAMREAVTRRYKRLTEEQKSLPDLIIIDGGKGQLSSAVQILNDLNILDKVTVIGLAKRLEEVFFPGASEAVMLPKTSSSLKLIQQLRDEAHRFAVSFHRERRDKRTLKTILTDIPGVGEKTAVKLLTQFGSVENIRNIEISQLSEEVGEKLALSIKAFLHENL